MQFVNNLVASILAAINYRWERVVLNFPFRMAVGRFGIRLTEFGRILQVRYANWNGEFRLKQEFHPNPNVCTLHVSDMVTKMIILTFESPNCQPKEMTPMVKTIFGIKGVARVTLKPYAIGIEKARVFSWQELLPSVEKIVLEHLTTATS